MVRRIALLFAFALVCSVASAGVLNDRMLVSTDWLAKNLDNVTVIEIGDSFTYGSGHIPGARLVPFAKIIDDRNGATNELPPVPELEALFTAAGIGDGRPIVIYSRDPLYSTRAFFTLDYLGQGSRTAILDGLWAKWHAEARQMAQTVEPVKPVPFHSVLNPGALAAFNTVKQIVGLRPPFSANAVLIDARPPEQYDGAVAGVDVKRAGHIPGAVNVAVAENFRPGAIPVFKSEADLRALYAKAGVTDTSTNIVYCRTGMQASLTYFVLRYLGYDARLYDGSFTEWSNAKDTTVS
jgi:thiosulfate/3-mercaptopyruvate sulfurtransferase